ncbi:MAG: Calx-beta domain-containing protein [Gammaproteobacteria bacterium]
MNSKIIYSKTGFLKSCVLVFAVMLQACGGSSSGGGDSATGPGDIIGTGIRGTAAVGAALANAEITVKSTTGEVKVGTTAADGKFQVDDLQGTGPYLLRAAKGNSAFLYSIAHKGADNLITRNIHPYTDLIIRNWFAREGRDIDTAFAGTTAINQMPNQTQIDQIKTEIQGIVAQLLERNSVTGADLLSSPFDTNNNGFDAFLDQSPVTIINNQITVIFIDPVTTVQNTVINNIALNTDFTVTQDTPPTVPKNISAAAVNATELRVTWEASSDDKGVAGYNVYRDGNLAATTPHLSFTDAGLVAGTQYSYEVEAIDSRQHVSARSVASTPVSVGSDNTDTTPPAEPAVGSATATDQSITVTWTAPADNDVVGYRVFRGAVGNVTTEVANVSAVTYTDASLAAATEFCYRIEAYDAADNRSPKSNEACATTAGVAAVSSLTLSADTFAVNEAAGSIGIVVNRTGDLSQPASVDYKVENGTATDGQDFNAITGTLNWAATDIAAKTITVQILSDSASEGNETVQITLLNPVNATLGTSVATLTITDSTAVACTAANSFVLSESNVDADTVLDLPCYLAPNGLSVNNPARLTINPGVQLRFAAGQELLINDRGSLNAVGTATAPIIIGSSNPTPGFWKGILFSQSNSSASHLEFTTVEYGQTNLSIEISRLGSAGVSLKDVTLRNGSERGMYIKTSPASQAVTITEFKNVTITGNGLPVELPDNMVGVLGTDSHYSGNIDDRIYIFQEGIKIQQAWKKLDVPYFMATQDAIYTITDSLSIEPGGILEFNSGAGLRIERAGSLKAIGTPSDNIILTGSTQSKGYWNGVEFFRSNSVDNQLDYVMIEYAQSNLEITGHPLGIARISIKNTTLQNAAVHGILFDVAEAEYLHEDSKFENLTVTGNQIPVEIQDFLVGILNPDSTFVGNADDRIHIVNQAQRAITTSQIWAKLDVPYFFSKENTFYMIDSFVTIQPGVTLIFNAKSRWAVDSNGFLNARGTASEPIVFTGQQDIPGYWAGIHFGRSNNVNNQFDHVVIEYGGSTNSQPGNNNTSGNITMDCFLSSNAAFVSITNSTLKDSGGWGIYRRDTLNCHLTQTNNTFSNNFKGDVNQ